MSLSDLVHLVAEARSLANDDPCVVKHIWESDGGRACPRFDQHQCSQTVYRCARCGEYDYGQAGGPAHDECHNGCPNEHRYWTPIALGKAIVASAKK